MRKSRRMASLGRKGGRAGGPARARRLAPARRASIARQAARARWSKTVFSQDARLDLASLVAHAGSSVAPAARPAGLEALLLRAVRASRRDAALLRMLPVFVWRQRQHLDLAAVMTQARPGDRGALGFVLELTSVLGRTRRFDSVLRRLRARAK